MTERYRNVHRRGFEDGMQAATEALVGFLESGGQIALVPFTRELTVRYPAGLVAHVYSLKALAAHVDMVRRLTGENSGRPDGPGVSEPA